MKNLLLLLSIIIAFSSCKNMHQTADLQAELQPVWKKHFAQNFDTTKPVEVFVATNRKAKNSNFSCGDDAFGVDLGDETRFGICKISVPKNHNVGELQGRSGSGSTIDDKFKILEAKNFSESDFFREVEKSKATPLIFIHGFNVRFSEAILRASQIAYDLKYQGPVVVFSWPSGAKDGALDSAMLNKIYDENFIKAQASVAVLKNFLSGLESRGIRTNMIVHSMGHQVVLPALKKISEENPRKILAQELFLNAPDFDLSEFRSTVKNIKSTASRITLYCSNNDKALSASKIVNKNDRLGNCANIDGVDVVNVAMIDDSTLGLGHGYYSSREVLSDVFLALLGLDVRQRLFVSRSDLSSKERFWLRK